MTAYPAISTAGWASAPVATLPAPKPTARTLLHQPWGHTRQSLADRGAWANIKPMPNRVRIPAFSRFLYRYRNLVERFFSKLKHFRAVSTRYEKHAENYLALIKLASARIWMRFMSR